MSDCLIAPMPKQVSALNTFWLFEYLRQNHSDIDPHDIVKAINTNNPYHVENLRTGKVEKVSLEHLLDTEYWFSNRFMIDLYNEIQSRVPDPLIAYKMGKTSYKALPIIKTAIGVPLLGPRGIIKKIVKENSKYNRTKENTILVLEKGHLLLRLTHYEGIIINKFAMEWHRGVYEAYSQLAGATDVKIDFICVDYEKGVWDFDMRFKEPSLLSRLLKIILFNIPLVKDTIEKAEEIQLEHKEQILNRDKIIEERTTELRNANEALKQSYQDLQEAKEREQYLDQQLRIRDVLQTSEDVGAQILHENKNLLQPLGNLINRTSRLISYTKGLLSKINENQELRNNVDKKDIENLEFLLDTAEKGNQAADASYRLIMSSYEDFRQAYNPREEGRNDLNRDLGAVTNLIIDRNYRSFIKVTKEFKPVRVPQEYDSSRFNKGVFWNIIKNAREAIIEENSKHAAAYEGKILLRTESVGNKTVVSIYDNGVGVPEGYEEKMFEKKETTKASGTGLGLYTARLILNENNCGKIYYQKSDLPDFKTKMVVELDLK